MWNAKIIVADDMQINRELMKKKLDRLLPNCNVQLFDNAEAILQQDLSDTQVLVIDNDFGVGKMTGVQAVQLIRHE